MSIAYEVEENGLQIYAFPKGILDIGKTLDYFEQLKDDSRIRQGAIEIVDFREVTDFRISYLESQKITTSYQQPKAIRRIKATIFVCETDLAYGIGRMLQTLHEIANRDHKVVLLRSEKEVDAAIKNS